jgi:hypothetical protein
MVPALFAESKLSGPSITSRMFQSGTARAEQKDQAPDGGSD